jgi:hypothetical protein
VKRRLAVFTLLAGAVWLGTPDRADAQGVFEGGIGYEIPTGTMADYLDGGVDFALLLGYRFQQVPGTSTVVCNPFCWVTAGVSQTNFSLGAGAQFNYKLNRRVAVGVNAKYFWIFGVDVANTVIDAGSRTLGSIPITGIVRVYQ